MQLNNIQGCTGDGQLRRKGEALYRSVASCKMDFAGQKQAEQLCLYIIVAFGGLAFLAGWFDSSFALMMKVDCLADKLECEAPLIQFLRRMILSSLNLGLEAT